MRLTLPIRLMIAAGVFGTRLVFENERVRVWEFTLEPGESIGARKHDHDFFFYPIEGGTL